MNSPQIATPTAAECMTRTVHTVHPDTEITQAVGLLTQHSCAGAPVLSDTGQILGVLTHDGCMRALSGAAFNGEYAGRVADHMARSFAVVEPTADLFHVVSVIENANGNRLLVVDNGQLVGVITHRDVLRALEHLRQQRTQDNVTIQSVAAGWSALRSD